jgi:dethiobiotin synthetase
VTTAAPVVLVTGTGTGVGKTVVTAAVAACARRSGASVAVVKPVQTGVTGDEPGDAAEVARLTGLPAGLAVYEHLRLPDPLAPQAAAARAGVRLPPIDEHGERIRVLAGGHDLVVVEGAGGLLVRLDAGDGTLADLAAMLRPVLRGVLVVVHAGLGTLNHSELTVRALAARRLPVLGLVIGDWPARPGPAEQDNLTALPRLCGVPLVGAVPWGAGTLDASAFAEQAPGWLAAPIGGTFRPPGAPATLSTDNRGTMVR